jgi:UDP-glucose 4-epimerase
MRVFLTGSSGFIGSHLTKALCKAGYEVTVLCRSAKTVSQGFEHELKTLVLPEAGLRDLDIAFKKGFDVVCHLAAFSPDDHSDPSYARSCLETNVMLSLNLLQASVRNDVKRFVYFSAGNAYSQDNLETPAKESDLIYPSRISPFYLGSKLLAEILVEHYRHRSSLETVSLRISSPYGIGMPPKSVVMKFIQRTTEGLPVELHGDGQYKTDLVFVGDVVDAALAAMHKGPPGIYNIGSGVSTSLLDLVHTIAEVFERRVPIETVSTKSERRIGFRPLDIGKARAVWQWHPRSLQDGLRAMRAEMSQG